MPQRQVDFLFVLCTIFQGIMVIYEIYMAYQQSEIGNIACHTQQEIKRTPQKLLLKCKRNKMFKKVKAKLEMQKGLK